MCEHPIARVATLQCSNIQIKDVHLEHSEACSNYCSFFGYATIHWSRYFKEEKENQTSSRSIYQGVNEVDVADFVKATNVFFLWPTWLVLENMGLYTKLDLSLKNIMHLL